MDDLRSGVEDALVASSFVAARPVRVMATGFSSVVFSAGPDVVVRAVTTAEAAAKAGRTVRLLSQLADALPVKIPTVVVTLPSVDNLPYGAAVVESLPGRTLRKSMMWRHVDVLARQTAGFLATLHTLDDRYRVAGVDSTSAAEVKLVESTVPMLADHMTRGDFDGLSHWHDRFLDWYTRTNMVPVHGDLWHEIMHARRGRLTAVLDWEAAGFAPAAVDLCGLWYVSEGFGDRVTRYYARARGLGFAGLLREVRLCRVRRELDGAAWSIRHTDTAELSESIVKLRNALAFPSS